MYTYNDMPDKSKEGIDKEINEGLLVASVYFQTTLGIPLEVFNEWIGGDMLKNRADQLLWYMNFRNQHPELF